VEDNNACGWDRTECPGDIKPSHVTSGLHIFESHYGVPGREMQVGAVVAARCEGRFRCEFPVSNA
jgi:hypothetical protein